MASYQTMLDAIKYKYGVKQTEKYGNIAIRNQRGERTNDYTMLKLKNQIHYGVQYDFFDRQRSQ